MPSTTKARARWPHVLFAAYCVATLLAVTWPVYPRLGNRIEPLVLGLPYSLAWLVGWVVATFVVLVVYERCAHRAD
jgi:hypothetical protein